MSQTTIATEAHATVAFDTALTALSPATLAALTMVRDQALAACPTEHRRIHRGYALAAMGAVDLHGNGTASVYSQALRVWYVLSGKHCPCTDHLRAPGGKCKHRWAACVLKRAYTQLAMRTDEPLDHLPAPYTFPRFTKFEATYWGQDGRYYGCTGIAIRCGDDRFTFIPAGWTNGFDVAYADVALGYGLDE